MTALILHIPHASTLIPPEERAGLLPDDARLARELLQMTDAWTDRLVEGLRLPAARIAYPVSRLVVDVERFPEDFDEPMAGKGMGAVYTRLSTGESLRSLEPAERARLMAKWYYPHHAKITDAVDAALAAHGRCLILDIHSFSSRPLPHEPDQDPNRPEICIGTDTFHSPFQSDAEALSTCVRHGFQAALNRPFSGSFVPSKHWGRTRAVRSVMIEVRRDLYMSETTGLQLPEFDPMGSRICRLIEAITALHTLR
jgi:N-formylglutamate deformylase